MSIAIRWQDKKMIYFDGFLWQNDWMYQKGRGERMKRRNEQIETAVFVKIGENTGKPMEGLTMKKM